MKVEYDAQSQEQVSIEVAQRKYDLDMQLAKNAIPKHPVGIFGKMISYCEASIHHAIQSLEPLIVSNLTNLKKNRE